jgi:hypothetical protein
MTEKTPGQAFWDAYIAAHPYGHESESFDELADENRAAINAGVNAARADLVQQLAERDQPDEVPEDGGVVIGVDDSEVLVAALGCSVPADFGDMIAQRLSEHLGQRVVIVGDIAAVATWPRDVANELEAVRAACDMAQNDYNTLNRELAALADTWEREAETVGGTDRLADVTLEARQLRRVHAAALRKLLEAVEQRNRTSAPQIESQNLKSAQVSEP